MALIEYFDESEAPEGRKQIAVAGFLFTPAGYARFYRAWKATVLRHGSRRFTHFHMTDLYAGKREYAGVPIPERVDVLESAVAAISKHIYASIGVQFDQQELEELAPVEWPKYFGSIYTAACHMCIQAAAHGLNKWSSSEKIHYTFEDGHKFRAQASSLMDAISKNAAARKDLRYRGHSFEDKRNTLGLQAADPFAWNIVKVCQGSVPPSLRPFLPSIRRFALEIKTRQMFFPLTGERLVAFMTDQMQGTWSPQRYVTVDFGPRKRTLR